MVSPTLVFNMNQSKQVKPACSLADRVDLLFDDQADRLSERNVFELLLCLVYLWGKEISALTFLVLNLGKSTVYYLDQETGRERAWNQDNRDTESAIDQKKCGFESEN